MEKLKKITKGLDVFLKIVFWLLVVVCAVVVIFSAIILIGGEGLNNWGELAIAINGVSFDGIDISGIDFTKTFSVIAVLLLATGAFVLYGIRVILKTLQPMKQGKPFDTAVSKNFKKLGWLSLIYGVAETIMNGIAQKLALSALAETASQAGITLRNQYVYNGSFVLLAILLFLFSYIFKYGEELQAQSDETL